ncbi:hypothetical protein M0R45_035185 [Rubus argutus]|uniref:Uncharacterized protein n=1 Tax=Rubus argutus TaxID=59490 RepID=A0AAW1VUV2_RUBAR
MKKPTPAPSPIAQAVSPAVSFLCTQNHRNHHHHQTRNKRKKRTPCKTRLCPCTQASDADEPPPAEEKKKKR